MLDLSTLSEAAYELVTELIQRELDDPDYAHLPGDAEELRLAAVNEFGMEALA